MRRLQYLAPLFLQKAEAVFTPLLPELVALGCDSGKVGRMVDALFGAHPQRVEYRERHAAALKHHKRLYGIVRQGIGEGGFPLAWQVLGGGKDDVRSDAQKLGGLAADAVKLAHRECKAANRKPGPAAEIFAQRNGRLDRALSESLLAAD